MSRTDDRHPARSAYLPPVNRPLKIYAYDPMLRRMPLGQVTVKILNESLQPGPRGSRVEVIDYDGVAECFYEPVDLDDPAMLMQGGLDPAEDDPRFHQQMVFAVTMRVIENFEIALGRRFHFRRRRRLKIFPHAFRGKNAYYDPHRHAIFFGYFAADRDNPGPNLPGQTVFACLSHDIIAHEVTHAIVHRLRRHFAYPTNADVLAFHEGFADIVAIFQHFSFPEILHDAIRQTRGSLRDSGPLVSLAEQFGYATGRGAALRTAIGDPTAVRLGDELESHRRGSVLVASVFAGFFQTFQDRISDLLRIATGGTGRLPEGEIHPDLVDRVAREATGTATATLRICIRAFDYLPPVDVTFGDFLRAMVTADFELNPSDATGLRRNMVDAFRARGIFPDDVESLSESSVRWRRYEGAARLSEDALEQVHGEFIQQAADTSRNSVFDRVKPAPPVVTPDVVDLAVWANSKEGRDLLRMVKKMSAHREIKGYGLRLLPDRNGIGDLAAEGRSLVIVAAVKGVLHFRIFEAHGIKVVDMDEDQLMDRADEVAALKSKLAPLWGVEQLSRGDRESVIESVASTVRYTPGGKTSVKLDGVHPSFRVAQDGQLLVETVIQFVQTVSKPDADTHLSRLLGGLPLRSGATVLVRANGQIQYVIAKPLPNAGLGGVERALAQRRLDRCRKFVSQLDETDFSSLWLGLDRQGDRIVRRMSIRALDTGAI